MEVKLVHRADNQHYDEVIDLLCRVDAHATGHHYTTSTAQLSRAMHPERSFSTEREALEAYYDAVTEYVVLAFESSDLVGCSLLETHEENSVDEDYVPALFVSFSAVAPAHQRQGVWTAMRERAEALAREADVDYLLSTVETENTASMEANRSRGMDVVTERHESVLFALPVGNATK